MRAGLNLTLVAAALLAAAPAAAACRCVCLHGRPVQQCAPGEVTQTLCQTLCTDPVGPAPLRFQAGPTPLAGGGRVTDSVSAGDQFGTIGQYGR